MDRTSGLISWRDSQTLDYETTQFYLFSIRCVDNTDASNIATAMVNVSVLPVNEFSPVIRPTSLCQRAIPFILR